MKQAPVDPERDALRVAEIDRYRLTEFAGRKELVGLADLAARVCGVSYAMITYIDDTHLRMLATSGFEAFDVPRPESICNSVLYDTEQFAATDLLADDSYSDSLAAQSGLARFYATQKLTLPDSGEPIGSLCIFDPSPHSLYAEERQALHDLAARVVDIIELELRTRMLSRAVMELERSNEALTAFAGQISHDLTNPLAAVAGNLEILGELVESTEPDVDRMRDVVGRSERSVSRMAGLLKSVLTYATLEGTLSPERVDVAMLVAGARDDLAAGEDVVDLRLGALADVTADPDSLRIVLLNLLSNALKHAGSAAPRVEVDAVVVADPLPTWRLRVADHGKGLEASHRERVFDELVRVDRTVGGSGLGLATCRRVVERHGGRIWLDETPGGGTTAWVEIPVETARHGPTSTPLAGLPTGR